MAVSRPWKTSLSFITRAASANANLDPVIRPLGLSKEELADLVAFLKAL